MKIWALEKTEVLGCEVRLFVIMMTVVEVAHCSGKSWGVRVQILGQSLVNHMTLRRSYSMSPSSPLSQRNRASTLQGCLSSFYAEANTKDMKGWRTRENYTRWNSVKLLSLTRSFYKYLVVWLNVSLWHCASPYIFIAIFCIFFENIQILPVLSLP